MTMPTLIVIFVKKKGGGGGREGEGGGAGKGERERKMEVIEQNSARDFTNHKKIENGFVYN